jgi:hypothetical protein
MYRYLSVVGLLALAAQGCAGPASAPKPLPLSSFSAKYQSWGCDQLAEEAGLLDDALAVAADGERVAHIKRASAAVRKQADLKGCKLEGSNSQ